MFARHRRFVDKTPESCLRIPYLHALFPDATFVFLRRRAADNVNSLMEAWRARPRFVKYTLPEELRGLGVLSGNRWSFTLVPGWRDLRDAPLEAICAHQYIASNEAVLDARSGMDESRWVDVFYEELVSNPARSGWQSVRGAGPLLHRQCRAVRGRPRRERLCDFVDVAASRQVARSEPRGDRAHPSASRWYRTETRLLTTS